MAMKAGDIVRVIKQPPELIVRILDEVGWIEDVQELNGRQWAPFNTLQLDGSPGGCGGVPLDCLAPEHGEAWKQAKERRDAEVERYHKESLERTKRWQACIARVAEKHGVTPEKAKAIFEELNSWEGWP